MPQLYPMSALPAYYCTLQFGWVRYHEWPMLLVWFVKAHLLSTPQFLVFPHVDRPLPMPCYRRLTKRLLQKRQHHFSLMHGVLDEFRTLPLR